MKDRVFSGRDVDEALELAARALGLPREALRYVVLDKGVLPAGRSSGRPAEVAVLLDRGGPERRSSAPPQPPGGGPALEPLARVRALIRAVAEAADLDLEAEVERGEHDVRVRLLGDGSRFFLGQEGEVLRALQHLLLRALGHELPGRLLLECEGYREQREAALRAEAARLAEDVKRDGQPRAFGPLNSYERRIVHVALAEVAGVRSFSVGEGSERRLTVAPASPDGDPG